jgi:L-fuculose-phosphate aldolase
MEALKEANLRLEIVEAAKEIYNKNLVQAGEGNISMRIPGKEELLITPTYNQYYNLKKTEIVHLKFDGTKVSKGRSPSSEYKLHVAIYQARPRAKAVIHTHSPYATAMSIARKSIPIILEEQVIFLGGSVPISEFGPANTADIGQKALEALGTKNGTLLANHGGIACGRTMNDTIKIAELIEKLAMIYTQAELHDGATEISPNACSHFMPKFEENFATHDQEHGVCS